MRYLVDTNLLVNIVEGKHISDDVYSILNDYENIGYISSESIKEFIHLIQLDKLRPQKSIKFLDIFDFVENTLGLAVKYVKEEHLKRLATLDTVKDHTDPSDRLIIAVALTERFPIISSDKYFKYYKRQGLDLIFNK
jgi:PIN domain nuclease of toxin-antitoxin system